MLTPSTGTTRHKPFVRPIGRDLGAEGKPGSVIDEFFEALKEGDFDMARRFIWRDRRLTIAEGVDGWNALFFAVHHDDSAAVTELVLLGCDINHQADDGATPLIHASRVGHVGSVAALYQFDYLDVDAQTVDGMTALTCALGRGFSHIARMHLDRHASVVLGAGDTTPLELARSVDSLHRDILDRIQARYQKLH